MPKDVHPNGDKFQQQKCSAFEAARGSQFCRICFVVGHLKYQSTSACPPPRIFSKLASCIICVQSSLIADRRGSAIRPAVETLQKANRSCGRARMATSTVDRGFTEYLLSLFDANRFSVSNEQITF